jgi:hypothetical protein
VHYYVQGAVIIQRSRVNTSAMLKNTGVALSASSVDYHVRVGYGKFARTDSNHYYLIVKKLLENVKGKEVDNGK